MTAMSRQLAEFIRQVLQIDAGNRHCIRHRQAGQIAQRGKPE
jgi:hypothetical protein